MKVSKCQKKMAEDLSFSDMALNSQLGTKMEQNTEVSSYLIPQTLYVGEKSQDNWLVFSTFYWSVVFKMSW